MVVRHVWLTSAARSPCQSPSLCGLRVQRQAPIELGRDVPAESGVGRCRVRVSEQPLDRLRVEHGARAACLEEASHGLDGQLDDERLVAKVACAVYRRERLTPRGLVEHLVDVVAMERACRLHLPRRLGQSELKRDGAPRPSPPPPPPPTPPHPPHPPP